ncbi:MAG: hypothetical protein R3Y50_09170 [Rikenellaceae bacterium]
MKNLLLILTLLSIPIFSFAQVRAVTTDVYGQISVMVELPKGGYVEINQDGKVLSMDTRGLRAEYYSNFRGYEAAKIKRVGDVNFKYHSDLRDYEAGKIASIGAVKFEYYDKFRNYNNGKIKSVARVQFEYYNDFRDYAAGKIRYIASNHYTYSPYKRNKGSLEQGVREFKKHGIIFRVVERFYPSRPQKPKSSYFPDHSSSSIRDRNSRY